MGIWNLFSSNTIENLSNSEERSYINAYEKARLFIKKAAKSCAKFSFSSYKLEVGEFVIYKSDVSVLVEDLCEAGTLFLTNKNLILESKKEVFDNNLHYKSFPLYEGSNSVSVVKNDTHFRKPIINVALLNKERLLIHFLRLDNNQKISEINKFIEHSYHLFNRHSILKYFEGKYVACKKCDALVPIEDEKCFECGATMHEGNSNTIICPKCGKENPITNSFCISCGNKLEKEEKKNEETVVDVEKQIDLLNKLKFLLDNKIITQEEFEKKKKVIMSGK